MNSTKPRLIAEDDARKWCRTVPGMRTRKKIYAFVAAGIALFVLPNIVAGTLAPGQTRPDVVFSDYGTLASNLELTRRLLSPLTAALLNRELLRSGRNLASQAVDLAAERFLLYVPSERPARGYGLLVFVPPWDDARLPQGWGSVLDRSGVIYISAARSGNKESVLGRREPLALLAAENAIRQYPVDPDRVYIAGFSGGSHVALRLVLGYPDLFRGAILNAGSDPIGSADVPLPPKDLFLIFQSSVHLIYVTGDRDEAHASEDLMSVRSMHHWCVFNVESFLEHGLDHEVATAAALLRSLGALTSSTLPDPVKLSACRSSLDAAVRGDLQGVESLIATGQMSRAQKRLKSMDERFGGLAAPGTVDLASKLLRP